MIVSTGDTQILEWEHRDPDSDDLVDIAGSVTATLTAPSRATTDLPAPVRVSVGVYQVAAHFPTSGDWLITLTSTDPDETDEIAVYATPPGMAAPWAPTVREVAAHIPSRTRQVGTDTAPGDNQPAHTFNDATEPTGETVQSLIDRAVATVTGRTGTPIAEIAYPVASAAAALWAAYWVELGWPERDGDVQVWAQLRADAEAVTASALAVNVGGGTSGPDSDAVPALLAAHALQPPPGWADVLL